MHNKYKLFENVLFGVEPWKFRKVVRIAILSFFKRRF